MEFTSSAIAGAIAAFLLFYYYLRSSTSAKLKNSTLKAPLEVSGARPFIGHLQLLSAGSSNEELPHFKLGALTDKYGPIFTIRLGVHRVLVVSSWEFTKQLFTTNDVVIASRPQSRAALLLSYNNVMFGFAPYGPYWRHIRKLISMELLSIRRIELQKNMRTSEILDSMKELYKLWEEKKDGSGRVSVDLKHWIEHLVLSLILRLVTGKRLNGGGGKGADVAMIQRWKQVFREFFYLSGLFVPGDALPYLRWLDLGGFEKRMKENSRELDRIIGGWLAEHKEKEKSVNDEPDDFMDVMLSIVQSPEYKSEYDADTIIKSTSKNLIAGGSDTTSITLVWTLCLLLNNPHVLKKVQEELDKQVGRERLVNESDINNLVYLNAVIKESLRLYPAAPLSGPRIFTEDANVGGYHIPKGTWLISNLWKMQKDQEVWSEDACEFKPERFLGKHKDLDVKGQDYELIPFGAGRRMCPGLNFGLQMTHSVLASFLQGFEISTLSKVYMDESGGMTNSKVTPVDALVAPRLPPNLYN